MSGVYRLEISESEVELKEMLGKQKTASDKERVQILYLLKSKQKHYKLPPNYSGFQMSTVRASHS